MLTYLFLAALWAAVQGADHNVYKNCSQIPLCQKYRDPVGIELSLRLVDFNIYLDRETDLFFSSTGDNIADLHLSISAHQGDIFRVILREFESERYRLEHVLEGPPEILQFDDTRISEDSVEFTIGSHRAVVNFSPFNIQFYRFGTLQQTLDGTFLRFNSEDNSFTFSVEFPSGIQLYGLLEHSDNLALQSTAERSIDPYRLKNVDNWEYDPFSPMALYGSVPVVYAHGPQLTTGFFLHNAAEQWYETQNSQDAKLGSRVYVIVNSGLLDLFILPGPRPVDVVRQYTSLTGTAHLPQLWALGFHHCRWTYFSQADVEEVVASFMAINFPLDVIWLDDGHSDGWEYFVWNPVNFTDPVALQENISAVHKRMVMINDPHIKLDDDYRVYIGGEERDLYVKNPDGTDFIGECWPGNSTYLDFLNPDARDYYASLMQYSNWPGVTPVQGGIWNDMNEPSVFNDDTEKTMQDDRVHYGGVLHRDIHNIYGFLQTTSTHQGLLERDDNTKRPFVLTRSFFAGSQRYTAIWTGDISCGWDYLLISYGQCLTANILGIVFCGADVGGFIGFPDTELFQRWYQAGAWLPFYRAHSDRDYDRREPYLFNETVQDVLRSAVRQRYVHLPVWYTLFFEHVRFGDPIIRPLFYEYPEDPDVLKIDNQLLAGSDILVRAIVEPGVTSVPVYFPGGANQIWVRIDGDFGGFYPGTGYADVEVDALSIPVFYRAGSIIVTKQRERLSSDEMALDGHTIIVVFDARNRAYGRVYLDDHTSFRYRDELDYNYLAIDFVGPFLTIEPIDELANTDEYSLLIEEIIVLAPVSEARNGKPGKFVRRSYKNDLEGQVFSDMKLNFANKTTFKLW